MSKDLSDLLLETREELSRIENKISIILGISTGILAFFVNFILSDSNQLLKALPLTCEVLIYFGIFLIFLSSFFSGFSIWPKTTSLVTNEKNLFFGTIASMGNESSFNKLISLSPDDFKVRTAFQIISLSLIVNQKYKFLKLSMGLIYIGMLLISFTAIYRHLFL